MPDRRAAPLGTHAAVVLVAMAGNANVSFKPILIASYVEFLHYSASTAGYLLSVEATATSVGTALGALFGRRFARPRLLVTALAAIVLGNLLSLEVRGFVPLAAVRAGTGLGHGIGLALTAAFIADFAQPDRAAGIVTVGVGVLAVSGIYFITWAQQYLGLPPLFLTMLGFALLPLLLLRRIPRMRAVDGTMPTAAAAQAPRPAIVWMTLVAVAFFYLSVGSFWPFAAQLGRYAGLSYQGAAHVVLMAAAAGMLGGLTAIVVGDRLGRVLPISLSMAAALVGLLVLWAFPTRASVFAPVVIIYIFSWATMYPFMLGFASELDPTGRVNGLIFSLSLVGLAIGPGLGSAVITLGATRSSRL